MFLLEPSPRFIKEIKSACNIDGVLQNTTSQVQLLLQSYLVPRTVSEEEGISAVYSAKVNA